MNDIKTIFPGEGAIIVTQNASGELYILTAAHIIDILADWNGDCEYVPANDAPVYFAAWNSKPINPYLYSNFESLLSLLREKL